MPSDRQTEGINSLGIKLSRFCSRWCFRVLLAAAIVAFGAHSDYAEEPPASQPGPYAGFWIGSTMLYGMSFQIYDWCDDRALGDIFRRAILENFGRETSESERENFSAWAAWETTQQNGFIQSYIAVHGKLPARGHLHEFPLRDELKDMTCQEFRNSGEYIKNRVQLESYARGEIAVEAVFPPR